MSHFKRFLWSILLLFGFLFSSFIVSGQGDAVVYAVLFYRPTCPHCHTLITEDLPPIQEQFGDSLVVFLIDTSSPAGNEMAMAAYEYYNIPQDRWVVPMMFIKDQVLIGGSQIPAELPVITQEGLDNGGIPIPSVPLMQAAFAEWEAENAGAVSGDDSAPVVATDSFATVDATSPVIASFQGDPLASTITIAILVGLILSVIGLTITYRSGLPLYVPQVIVIATTLIVFFLALTIILAEQSDGLAFPVAGFTFVGIMISSALAIYGDRIRAAVSLLTFVGVAISAYMAYIEITANPAVCGSIGDCNAVQQSPYAYLLGIPIGLIGVVGYLLMFVTSLAIVYAPEAYRSRAISLLKLLVVVAGGFTIYLTFLEPFVIGAVCAWCLLSSLVILNLMWMVMPMVQIRKRKTTPYLLYQPATQ